MQQVIVCTYVLSGCPPLEYGVHMLGASMGVELSKRDGVLLRFFSKAKGLILAVSFAYLSGLRLQLPMFVM